MEQFSRFGVLYEQSAKAKSDLYVGLLPLLNSRRIELLDNQRLTNQLIGLERRPARGGRDSIDHSPGAHDDVVNAVAGVAAMITAKPTYNLDALADTMPDDPLGIESYRRMRYAMYLNSGGRVIL